MNARRIRVAAMVALPALLAPLAVGAGAWAGGRWILPLAATLAVFPSFAALVVRGRRGAAILAALLWAAALSLSIILMTRSDPAAAARVVFHGEAYRDEMFRFIESGSGREAEPARFLPQHLLHLCAFTLLCLGSGGLLGLALGAGLVGYMSFYIGALAAACPGSAIPWIFGWPPWAAARVGAFVILGVLLSRPLLVTFARRLGTGPEPPASAAGSGRWLLAAALLLAGDVVLKALLAPHWAVLLRPCL